MKNDNLKRVDASPVVLSGDFVATQSVVAITNLSVTGPYRGDFQVVDNGRVIVGEDPDIGGRGILGAKALQGFNANGLNTFAVWFATSEGHAPGDFHAGNLGGNYLAYNQADGTLGLYTPEGAGVIMDNDGTFIAGHQDHGHMKWDAVSESLKIMSGREVMAEFGDAGSATFQGIVTATGGRITGRMVVDDVLQVGDVDGPAVYVGKFIRTNDAGEDIETAEIIATDEANLPWFHVVAGGDTRDGFFHLGGTGDFDQKLEYDGTTLRMDGEIVAQAGTFAGTVTVGPAGSLVWANGKGKADYSGLLIRAYDLNVGPDQQRNYLRFVTASDETLSWLGGYYSTTANSIFMRADSTGKTRNATTTIQAAADIGYAVEANIAALQGAAFASVAAMIDAAGATSIYMRSDKLGFHSVTPVARQLVATGAGHTVDDVITALQAIGLFRQS